MAREKKPQALTIPTESTLSSENLKDLGLNLSPNELAQIDVDKLKLLIELQERQRDIELQERDKEFQRELELKRLQMQLQLHEISVVNAQNQRVQDEKDRANREKEKKQDHQFQIQKLELFFKMFVSTVALALGTIFVLTGHEQLGTFLLGGAISTVTSGALALLRAAQRNG
jgi:hypothetical protein